MFWSKSLESKCIQRNCKVSYLDKRIVRDVQGSFLKHSVFCVTKLMPPLLTVHQKNLSQYTHAKRDLFWETWLGQLLSFCPLPYVVMDVYLGGKYIRFKWVRPQNQFRGWTGVNMLCLSQPLTIWRWMNFSVEDFSVTASTAGFLLLSSEADWIAMVME